jgi:hypothetical protein
MHRYNNQDHSMYTAMLTVENILDGAGHDIWAVNVEEEYHEEEYHEEASSSSSSSSSAPGSYGTETGRAGSGASGTSGTGRDAPVLPKKR